MSLFELGFLLSVIANVFGIATMVWQRKEIKRLEDEAGFAKRVYDLRRDEEKKWRNALRAELREKDNTIDRLRAENKRLRDFCHKSDEIRQQLVRERAGNG